MGVENCHNCRKTDYWIIMAGLFVLVLFTHTSVIAEAVQQVTNPHIVEHPEDTYVTRTEPATLNCKADGEPQPKISWYRDGLPVVTANENPASHRMLLPSGQLFFLKIIHNKNSRPDVGVYYCNATNPETRISVISRTAKLDIVVIRDDFREQPTSVEVALGHEASLQCKAPRGEPEPRVRWEKDGEKVKSDDRITVDDFGGLHLRDARKEDGGTYLCVAYNIGGERESLPALLSIREKPMIVDKPKDTVIAENGDVLLQCQATGDPEPVIIWKKLEGQIPAERSQILSDRSLKIESAQVTDEGMYVCRMENSVGWQEAEAKLTVLSRPSYVVTPRDKVVGLGRRVSMRCEMTGNPMPAVFWNNPHTQKYMFANQIHGRFRVTEDGTLIIDTVRREDAGEYSCQGISMAGTAYAKARLEVKDVDSRPPPIVTLGPQNQTLPTDGTAKMSCVATGEPTPIIRWFKNGNALYADNKRIIITDYGSLEINDLRTSDTGLFTCRATSESGETSWSATLSVETPTNPYIVFRRTPEPMAFPAAPIKPAITEISENTVRLTWKTGVNQGASPVSSYSIEYFSHDTGEGWMMASDSVTETTYVVRGLQLSTSYVFLLRARNSHGLSLPSPITLAVKTLGVVTPSVRPATLPIDLAVITEKLSGQLVHLHAVEVLSSTAVKLSWEVRRNQRFIEGFHVKYRIAQDADESQVPELTQNYINSNFSSESVLSPTATMYVLSTLQKFTWYEVRVQPFYSTVHGAESNAVRARTLEDVPSSPPRNIKTTMLENNTLHISWESPARRHRNGLLRGYNIYLNGNETRFNRQIQVNISTEFIFLRHLVTDMIYRLQMSAYNRMGEGIRSDIIYIGDVPSHADHSLLTEPWFIATLVATIGAALWLALCLFSVWIYRRHRTRKRVPESRSVSVTVNRVKEIKLGNNHISNHLSLLSGGGGGGGGANCHVGGNGQACVVAPCCYDNESPSDGDSKTNIAINVPTLNGNHTYQTLDSLQHRDLKTFGGVGTPYTIFSTHLTNGVDTARSEGCIPNPQAYMIHSGLPPNVMDLYGSHAAGGIVDNQHLSGIVEGDERMAPRLYLPSPPDHLSQSGESTMRSDRSQDLNVPRFLADYMYRCQGLGQGRSQDGHSLNGSIGHFTRQLTDPRTLSYNMFGCDLYPKDQVYPELMVAQGVWGTEPYGSDADCHSVPSIDDNRLFIDERDMSEVMARTAGIFEPTFSSHLDVRERVRKPAKHRQRATRPTSPYSTDSNYSAAPPAPHRPYPKSERRKQLIESRGRSPSSSSTGAVRDDGSAAINSSGGGGTRHSRTAYNESEHPSVSQRHVRPVVPYALSSANSSVSRMQYNSAVSSSLAAGGQGSLPGGVQSYSIERDTRANPLSSFDTTNTPVV